MLLSEELYVHMLNIQLSVHMFPISFEDIPYFAETDDKVNGVLIRESGD